MEKKQQVIPAYPCFLQTDIAVGMFLPWADCAGAKVRQTGNGAQDAT